MTADPGVVYVVGAAGHQGGAAVRHLRERGVEARALYDARDVRRSGGNGSDAHTVHFGDPRALERALSDAAALVVILEDPDTGPAERLRHGQALADAAIRTGVGRIVFVAASGPDHHRLSCDVSSEIARYLQRIGAPATVLRPATFMEEVPWYWLSRFGKELVLSTPFVAEAHLPLVALDDVGALAALAVTRPDEFRGRTIDVAGDTETPLAIADRLGRELGEDVRYEEVQVEGVFVYQEASTHVDDIAWLRTLYPRLHTFAGWLENGGGLDLCRHAAGMPASGERRAA